MTAAKMHKLGIQTGADMKRQSLAFLQAHFGKSGPWYFDIARGRDERPVRPDRERKSSGSETTLATDLTEPAAIEDGVLAMADDVWAWCEKTGSRGRTVTVKIKWADFQQSTRSRSLGAPVDSRAVLHAASLALIRSVYPPPKGIRLVGVALSNFASSEAKRVYAVPSGFCFLCAAAKIKSPGFASATLGDYMLTRAYDAYRDSPNRRGRLVLRVNRWQWRRPVRSAGKIFDKVVLEPSGRGMTASDKLYQIHRIGYKN